MSLKIITEIVEYVRRNPEIIGIIDRELNKFMVSTHTTHTQAPTHTRFNRIYAIK